MKKCTTGINKIFPGMPRWSNQIKRPGRKLVPNKKETPNQEVIYFSTCISRMMGGEIGNRFLSVCDKANIAVIIPKNLNGTCCGQIFSSKGFADAFRLTANATIEKLWQLSGDGKIPVVLDVTSCTQTIKSYRDYLEDENRYRYEKMIFIDVIDFAAESLLPRLNISAPKEKIVLHPVCSVFKMGLLANLQAIGNACAKKADIPFFAGCCGMAGDRGLYYPRLTAAATKTEAKEVNEHSYEGYYSSSTTCEMSMSDGVGKNYESILELLDEVSA